jgi:hypothetical protein
MVDRDIVTPFAKQLNLKYKAFHESFVVKNAISWRNIDFERSYVVQFSRRNQKEIFDCLTHSKIIPFLDFFICKCKNNNSEFRKSQTRKFRPDLWYYDNRHKDGQCPFRKRCDYFKLLQSVDKSLPQKEKIARLNKKGSLMRFKNHYRTMKPDYDIYLWVKNFNDTNSTIYKDEVRLLFEFKKYIFRKGKKQKIDTTDVNKSIDKRLEKLNEKEYKLKSPEYHPQSPNLAQ